MGQERYKLVELLPEWINGDDWGCGVSFTCPVHPEHRCTIHFMTCCSGAANPLKSVAVLRHSGASFATLTIWGGFLMKGCFAGTLAHGTLQIVAVA